MKKLILIIAIVFSGVLMQAQTDLDIANSIIGKPLPKLEQILTDLGLEFYITDNSDNNTTLYISINNSVRLWEIKSEDLYRERKVGNSVQFILAGENLITEIFVRYRHSNLNDLRDFNAYELPENTKFRTYEKALGTKISHFRITQS